MTCDKLIFPSAITRILRHFFVPISDSPNYTVMGSINIASVRQNRAQLRPKWPQMETTNPPTFTVPSTFAPSSLVGGVTLKAIMAQFQCMDAHLDTLSDELCEVNTYVGRIAQRQARLGGFAASPSLFLEASADEDGDDGDKDDDEMTTSR